MSNIFHDYKSPTSFKDHLESNYHVPYTIHIKKFPTEHIFPLHYGETFEILLCDDLVGKMTIGNKTYTLGDKQVFVIPPNTIHSNRTNKCNGTMYIIKIIFEIMSNFINIHEILEYNDRNLYQFDFTCPESDKIYQLLFNLIEDDENTFACLSHILSMFNIFQKYTNNYLQNGVNIYSLKNTSLKEIINWTQENFNKNINIDKVADKVGYSKCYFCNKFKDITGTTYLDYLNSVRISHACYLLKQNMSIIDVSHSCGFDNVSYFIQLFKKIQGITPKSFAKNHERIKAEYK